MSSHSSKHSRGFSTRAVHAGQAPDPSTGAVMTPIYATSTYAQSSPGQHTGWEYSRSGNPTRRAFEDCLASLESGARGFAFASGLAAEAAILDLLDPGAHIIAVDDLYGGTYRLFERVRKRTQHIGVSYVPADNIDALRDAIQTDTRMIWVETPTNPLMKIADLAAIGTLGRKHGILTVADNTFASPALQRPLELGFDLVVHSVTKYLNGHSDMVGGAVVTSSDAPELSERLEFLQNASGAILSPFDSFLALRGLKTLPLRMERHCRSAMTLATFLSGHKLVDHVWYPGLPGHAGHSVAQRQMTGGFGGMISIRLNTDLAGTKRFLEALEVFTLAESLGGVESLVNHPALMTHASLGEERRQTLGITDSVVRLSVGVEDPDDLIADLEQALTTINPA
ncbi:MULTISPECIES: trans-sulfuration enzyme family protein [unclassified Haematospirillum]|uniref:trans-sulfuration enzyme family protein n=1 Tax=unclassified Haematospirillum TaxID=2622088 RepID=UPI00143C2698|nr:MULTISPECIES: PLP-dependent transferase [unclassified Haematospirillum]NKD54352.1 PLP-dependent transferase [Haematospirillum sp. H4890]NKD74396.1 PLP-dependent transferase [Haematospirillum sp. H4485]NKD86933.1 PLP-dependent transferase [Haematospirillum sp. 15-248]